jgi:hypothetical protein
VELLCEKLGELGLPIGADTARELLREVLALESPRLTAHVRDALQTSLDTIRIAAQSASGVLRSTAPIEARAPAHSPKPVLDAPRRPTPRPAPQRRQTPPPSPPVHKRPVDPDDDGPDGEKRPVFRRPRGR